jgi:hypothetical protein
MEATHEAGVDVISARVALQIDFFKPFYAIDAIPMTS